LNWSSKKGNESNILEFIVKFLW